MTGIRLLGPEGLTFLEEKILPHVRIEQESGQTESVEERDFNPALVTQVTDDSGTQYDAITPDSAERFVRGADSEMLRRHAMRAFNALRRHFHGEGNAEFLAAYTVKGNLRFGGGFRADKFDELLNQMRAEFNQSGTTGVLNLGAEGLRALEELSRHLWSSNPERPAE